MKYKEKSKEIWKYVCTEERHEVRYGHRIDTEGDIMGPGFFAQSKRIWRTGGEGMCIRILSLCSRNT